MQSKIILVISLLFFVVKLYAQKKDKNSYGVNKNKFTGKDIVIELNKLNFFNLTDKKDLKITKDDFEKSYDNLNFFEGYMREDLSFTDNRFYFIDSETLFEGGGLTEYLEKVKNTFNKLNVKFEYSDEFINQTNNNLKHTIKINDKEYVAYDNDFEDKEWGIAYVNFIEMLNDQLNILKINEQFYPISSGNDGRIVLLTPEQFDFIQANYPSKDNPKDLKNWKKELGL